MKHYKTFLFLLLATAAFSCHRAKTWSCECQDPDSADEIFEGSQKNAQEWCDSKSEDNNCILVGHK